MSGLRKRRRARAVLAFVLYWGVVLAISLALVVALVLFLEARDESEIEGASRGTSTLAALGAVRSTGGPG